MRILCAAPEASGRTSPAVSVADGFPYPLGVEGGAKAKRPIDRVCSYLGDRKRYAYLRLCSVPSSALYCLWKTRPAKSPILPYYATAYRLNKRPDTPLLRDHFF